MDWLKKYSLTDLLYTSARKTSMCTNLRISLSGSTFLGNNALLSYNGKGFAMLPAQKRLAGNSVIQIVRFHVTSNRSGQ